MDAWIGKGKTFAGIDDADEALNAYNEAERILKEYPDKQKGYRVAIAKGNMYFKLDDMVQALDNYLRASDLREDSSSAHTLIANVYDRIGDSENAEYHRDLAQRKRRKRK